MPDTPVLSVRNVFKSYGTLQVLRDVSFDVMPGETVSIIGPSGSGKSTMLRCVNHLEKVNGGEIHVAGSLVGYQERHDKLYELHERDIARHRRDVGMVFQLFNLFNNMTVLQNVMVGPTKVLGESQKSARERAVALLTRVGLDSKLNVYPRTLSGGQAQRVAIARALAMRPKLMLFDEPTSALDPELVGDVLEVIRDIVNDGMTMVIVTHELAFAREVSDRLIFMADGAIVEQGSPADVLDNPRHARTREFLSRTL